MKSTDHTIEAQASTAPGLPASQANRLVKWFALGSLCLVAAIFIGLAWFAHPAGDDFCLVNQVERQGFWATQRFVYENYGGRPLTIGLICLHGAITKPLGIFFHTFRLVPVYSFAILFFGTWFFLKNLTRGHLSRSTIWWGSLGLLLLFVTGMPDRKSTRLNSSHSQQSRMPSSA